MFSNRDTILNLHPIFRAVYAMQFIAGLAIVASLFLIWWDSRDPQNLFELLDRSFDKLRQRNLAFIVEPMTIMWLLLPVTALALLRGFTGLLVTPVAYRRWSFICWGLAAMALAHFYINFGYDLADDSPLRHGKPGPGFWLTSASMALLALLLFAETRIRPPDRALMRRRIRYGKVNDAERLWEGDYQTCPHCGMLNEKGARTCYNCNNLLFSFDPDD